jgi:hypothetical protein
MDLWHLWGRSCFHALEAGKRKRRSDICGTGDEIHTQINPAIRELVEQLEGFEHAAPGIANTSVTCPVCEKLIQPLRLMVGSAGVSSLLQRALTLAQREASALSKVEVQSGGLLKGLEDDALSGSSVLVAHLIELLVTFIGESLTFRLLHEAWPELQALKNSAGNGDHE